MTKKKSRSDRGFEFFTRPYREQHVLTCPQGTVAYRLVRRDDPVALLKHHVHSSDTDKKIQEILAANPNIQFTPNLQEALGIEVIDFQPAPPQPKAAAESPKPKVPGIHISFEDEK